MDVTPRLWKSLNFSDQRTKLRKRQTIPRSLDDKPLAQAPVNPDVHSSQTTPDVVATVAFEAVTPDPSLG